MKKLAIITPGHLPVPAVNGGAVETLITYLIEENEKTGDYKIDLYTIYDRKLKNVHYKNTNIITIRNYILMRVIFKIFNIFSKIISLNKLKNYFGYKCAKIMNKENNKYDYIIVENNMIVYGELEKNYYLFKESKKIFHIHNVIYEKDDKSFKYLYEIIGKTSNIVLAVSNYIKEYFLSKASYANVKVYYNCIDFSIYNKNMINNKEIIRKKIDVSGINFIFTGRCVEDKGVMELVNSFNRLCLLYNNCSLSICGIHLNNPNKFEKKVLRICKKNSNIRLFDYTSKYNMVKYISASDCVVIPSKCDEAFGVVALEAMAMKKIIIATNSGGLVEPLNDKCSIIISRNNLENNLYESMLKIMENKDMLEIFSNNAFKRVHTIKEFDRKNYLKNFNKIIRSIDNE